MLLVCAYYRAGPESEAVLGVKGFPLNDRRWFYALHITTFEDEVSRNSATFLETGGIEH